MCGSKTALSVSEYPISLRRKKPKNESSEVKDSCVEVYVAFLPCMRQESEGGGMRPQQMDIEEVPGVKPLPVPKKPRPCYFLILLIRRVDVRLYIPMSDGGYKEFKDRKRWKTQEDARDYYHKDQYIEVNQTQAANLQLWGKPDPNTRRVE